MKCPKCDYEWFLFVGESSFCPKCGERLPDRAQLGQSAWQLIQVTDLLAIISVFVGPGLLGAGIALWFMGPAWFVYAETRTIQAISIVLMVGGPLLLLLAVLARKFAVDTAWRGARKISDGRPANVYLLLDVSGSMEGGKLSSAKKASESFLSQLDGEQDQVGLIAFSNEVTEIHPLGPADGSAFVPSIHGLESGGATALYDAVIHAIGRLQKLGSPDRKNVILAMTDGANTAGDHSLEDIGSKMSEAETPVSIFTVGYGFDADRSVLRQIAQWGNGQAYQANRRTVKKLYELLSAYV
ncbi:MAG: VWA domain-containing protein [Dehalococcoidia bacterium]